MLMTSVKKMKMTSLNHRAGFTPDSNATLSNISNILSTMNVYLVVNDRLTTV